MKTLKTARSNGWYDGARKACALLAEELGFATDVEELNKRLPPALADLEGFTQVSDGTLALIRKTLERKRKPHAYAIGDKVVVYTYGYGSSYWVNTRIELLTYQGGDPAYICNVPRPYGARSERMSTTIREGWHRIRTAESHQEQLAKEKARREARYSRKSEAASRMIHSYQREIAVALADAAIVSVRANAITLDGLSDTLIRDRLVNDFIATLRDKGVRPAYML